MNIATAAPAPRSETVTSARIPLLSVFLGFGPALVMLLIGAAAWLVPFGYSFVLIDLGRCWAAAILLFLAGVRRGLSFFTDGGPRAAQIATTMWLFLVGLAGILLPPALALVGEAIGFVSVALLDPLATRRGEVPAHFATLRPPQMALLAVGVAALFVWIRVHLA